MPNYAERGIRFKFYVFPLRSETAPSSVLIPTLHKNFITVELLSDIRRVQFGFRCSCLAFHLVRVKKYPYNRCLDRNVYILRNVTGKPGHQKGFQLSSRDLLPKNETTDIVSALAGHTSARLLFLSPKYSGGTTKLPYSLRAAGAGERPLERSSHLR
jgi:hypothetical protein